MRRLSMRTKRRKSERNSESETEENGVQSQKQHDASDDTIDYDESTKKDKENSAHGGMQSNSRKTTGKRRASKPRQGDEQKTKKTSTSITANTAVDHQTVKTKQEQLDDDSETKSNTEQENGNTARRGINKRHKKEDIKTEPKPASTRVDASGEEEYEVEKIVGHRTIKGRRQFLVRWKGYDEKSDTWEQEKDLNCPKLIEEFVMEDNEAEEAASEEKSPKTVKTKSPKIEKKKEIKKTKPNNKRQSNQSGEEHDTDEGSNSEDGQKEFEVDKIIEVHFKKNKKKDFLIRWKGFTPADDTWEPEENLNCPELIAKFMERVEKAKTTDMRELRTNPTHTKRYTLSTHDSGRRLSRRNMGKQRATYHECYD